MPHPPPGDASDEFRNPPVRNRFAPQPPALSRSTTDINAFRDILGEFNPQFFTAGQQLIDIGLGTATDPLIEAQRMRGIESLRGGLSRQGARGSVALNEINRANLGFDELALGRQRESLETGFGLQSIGLQQAAVPSALSIGQESAASAGRGGGGKK